MPLTYGFGLYIDEHREYWTHKFEALSDTEKDFYHNVLPFAMVIWGVSHISKKTIEEILVRQYESDIAIQILKEPISKEQLREELTKYIGYQANVFFESYPEWVKRQTRRGEWATIFKSKKAIEKEHTEFDKAMRSVGN